MSNQPKFKICLTMAGAVSAGAFTAGVMDYLLETLDIWEKAKQKNRELGKDHSEYDSSIPMHDVEIDVISGSSAGGITGSLAMLNLIDEDYQPVNKDNPFGKNNRFYQSWVEMGDDTKSNTFEKMLATGDLKNLKKEEKPKALLNSDPIDIIADNALRVDTGKFKSYPPYISDSLDLILTTTNLRGIKFKIDFTRNNGEYKQQRENSKNNSETIITTHAGFFRYKLLNEKFTERIPEGNDLYYVLDLNEENDVNYLKNATLSTAAFPIGLKSREMAVPSEYIERLTKYLFGDKKGITADINEPVYKFDSIDGGLINNEPFAIGLKTMRDKDTKIGERYAVIMIDPLPNKDNSDGEENTEEDTRDVISVAKGMFKSLRNQAMFNQDGILDALDLSNRTKFLIEPVRKFWNGEELERTKKSDLASAPFSGFAGFLHKSFREHDFQLGRLNCQTFLRYYFALPEENLQSKLGEKPVQNAFDRFYFHESRFDENSVKLFPIIPDLRMKSIINEEQNSEVFGVDSKLEYPEYPTLSKEEFRKKYKRLMTKRIESVSNLLLSNFWFNLANKLFIRKKIYNVVEKKLFKALKCAELTKE